MNITLILEPNTNPNPNLGVCKARFELAQARSFFKKFNLSRTQSLIKFL